MSTRRNTKCSLCPAWVEPGARHKYLCEPCWRLLDTLSFQAESALSEQRALHFDPFRTARTRRRVPRKLGSDAGIVGSGVARGPVHELGDPTRVRARPRDLVPQDADRDQAPGAQACLQLELCL